MGIRIIYLMGSAYSGSTILGAILGSHAEIWNGGELGYWTTNKRDDDQRRCACGETLTDCTFWGAARKMFLAKANIDDWGTFKDLQLKFERVRANPFLLHQQFAASPEFQNYASMTLAVIETLTELSGRHILIDTSKHPGRGLALGMINGIDVTYIHLVRNGLAFLASTHKHKNKKRLKKHKSLTSMLAKASLDWAATNLVSEYVTSRSKRPTVRIRYEDLVKDPRRILSETGRKLGIDLETVAKSVASGESISFHHAMAGNAVRMQGPVALRNEDEWRQKLPRQAKWIFWPLAGAVEIRYGYH